MVQRFKKIILIIVFLAATLFPAFYINSIYGYLPVFTYSIALGVSLFCLFRIRRNICVESDAADSSCERGGYMTAGLSVVNRSLFMSARTVVNVYISSLLNEMESMNRMYLTLVPGKRTQFGLNVAMSHIGIYHAGVKDMEMWDFFGLFRVQVPIRGEFEVVVRPKIRTMEELWQSEQVWAEASRDTQTTVFNGMDYVGIREYAWGDSMKRIHWKLSAHSQNYLTKLQESSRETEYAVILDFAAEKREDSEVLLDMQDSLIETALSIVEAISRYHTNFFLLYCDKHRNIQRITPKGRENDLLLVRTFSMITPDPDAEFPDAGMILTEELGTAGGSTNLMVCTSRVTDELLQRMLQARRESRVPELYWIVPQGMSRFEIEHCKRKIRQLDEAGIEHHFVFTDPAEGGAS